MGDVEVTVAATDHEVREAARALWPSVVSGQVGFPLAGQTSREELERAWRLRPDREGDELYVARRDGQVVGACGFFLSDDKNAQTICGPVAVDDQEAVYGALLVAMQHRHPNASIIVGISDRHVSARTWLEGVAVLSDHALPFEGRDLVGAVEAHVFTIDEQDAFVELFDRLIGQELWWRADRIREHWSEWICITAGDGESVLAARNYTATPVSEVFATSAPDADTLRAMLSTWIAVGSAQGRTEFVYFADPAERAVVASLGLRCDQEYLAYRVQRRAQAVGSAE